MGHDKCYRFSLIQLVPVHCGKPLYFALFDQDGLKRRYPSAGKTIKHIGIVGAEQNLAAHHGNGNKIPGNA